MQLTKDELKSLRPKNNNVLIKIDRSQDEINLKGGCKLYLDTSYEVEKHAPVTGTVVALPDELFYSRKSSNSMQWKTTNELMVGDYVIFYYMSSVNALDPKFRKFITCENETYLFIKYDNIYVAKRTYGVVRREWLDKIIPINGYLICEPLYDHKYLAIEKQAREMGLRLPRMIMEKFSVKFVRVRYIGKANTEYHEKIFSDDNCNPEVGDIVTIRKHSNIAIEYELHLTFDGKNKFIRIQRRYITGIVTDEQWKATLQTEILAS